MTKDYFVLTNVAKAHKSGQPQTLDAFIAALPAAEQRAIVEETVRLRNEITSSYHQIDTLCHASATNVFADLGFEDADNLQHQAILTYQIYMRLKALRLSPYQAGACLGIPHATATKLMHCKPTDLSTEQLQELLTTLEGMTR